jgi:hypothetical protein
MQSEAARSRRDAYFGIAAISMAIGYLLSASANITVAARSQFDFLGSALLEASWPLRVCALLLLAFGLAVMAVAFLGEVGTRDSKLRRGALIIAGGYGLTLVGGALFLVYRYRAPDSVPLQGRAILQLAAYLPALVAALLAASAFAGPRSIPGMQAVARNRLLGWASIGFGLQFALLLFSHLATNSLGWTWASADLAALAAAGVAAAGFFSAGRAYRLPSPGLRSRREGLLVMAAILFLLYRVLDLTHVGTVATRLWQLDSIVLAVAALLVVVGLAVSYRSLVNPDRPSLVTDNN